MLLRWLYCMALLSTAVPEDCQRENQTELVQECIANCSFSTLEGAMYEEENHLSLWITFHHPREALPHYLVVKYSTNANKTIYLWTSNSIYFVIPPHVFALLSLFMGMLDDDHTGEVNLTLPQQCNCWLEKDVYITNKKGSVMNYLEILTEKVCLIGNLQSNYSNV